MYRTNLTCLAIAFSFALVVFCGTTSATLICSDDFIDSNLDSELNLENGGIGFGNSWSAVTDITNLVNTPLSYTVAGGGTITANWALQTTGSDNSIASRTLATPVSDDEVFISYLLHAPSATSTGDYIWSSFWFTVENAGPNWGVKPVADTNDFLCSTSGSNRAYTGGTMLADTTYLIVGRYSKGTPGADQPYTQVDLWVNPDAELASPDASVSGTLPSSFETVGVRQVGTDPVLFSRLRIGTQWSDVVPTETVPEPSALMLLLAGMITTGILYKRRN